MKTYNTIQHIKLLELISFSDKYEIDIQFWPEQTAVYINKDGIELTSFGGDFNHAINSSIDYLKKINNKNAKK